MEGKSEEGAERLKAFKSDLTQGKIDADQYADSANTILVSIIQHAAQTTLDQIDSWDRLARDDRPDRQPDSEEAWKQQNTPLMTPRSRMPSPDFKQHEMTYKWPRKRAPPPTQ